MRLLWLKSDYIIPPDTGGKIRTYNLMRKLNQIEPVTYAALKNRSTPNDEPGIRECANDVFTVYRPEENKSGLGFYLRVLLGSLSSRPYIVQKYRAREIREYQRAFCSQYNDAVILCDFLEMADNVDWSTPAPKVLFQHNVETMIWRRYFEHETNALKKAYFNYEQKRMQSFETAACNKFDLVLTVSESDKRILRDKLKVTTPIEVIETGVDADYFAPDESVTPIPGRLVFLGSMDWMPNIDGVIWFVEKIYPLIKTKNPNVTLDIVGRRPDASVKRLGDRDQSIRVTGDVRDVRPYIAEAELFIVPLRIGGGTRIKIFEAMAMQSPVISTTVGAEGLPLTDGEHILLADSPEDFARRVNEALAGPDTRKRIAANGFNLVRQRYQWDSIAQKFHKHCNQLLAKSSVQELT